VFIPFHRHLDHIPPQLIRHKTKDLSLQLHTANHPSHSSRCNLVVGVGHQRPLMAFSRSTRNIHLSRTIRVASIHLSIINSSKDLHLMYNTHNTHNAIKFLQSHLPSHRPTKYRDCPLGLMPQDCLLVLTLITLVWVA
jgi:hypothetical protein